MVVLTEMDVATPGETDSPPATTEDGTSPQTSIIGSPDAAAERMQSPVMAIGSPDLSTMEAEVMKDIEPLVDMPMTPPLADETPPDEMTADVIEADDEKVEDEAPPDEAPSEEMPTGEDEVDEPEQTSEAVTEIAADATPVMKKEENGAMETVEAAVEESVVQAADSTSGGCKMAQQALSNVKESAHQAVEAIGNKMAKFFGNMRKVKSLLHINEAAESGKEEEAKALSNSTGNLHKLTDSIKHYAAIIIDCYSEECKRSRIYIDVVTQKPSNYSDFPPAPSRSISLCWEEEALEENLELNLRYVF